MSNYIDPTYLRAIREGLLSGKLEKENEVELPEGLAELFDKELFPLNNTISEKQLLLHFFSSFALLQKNANPQFIAEILDWEERKVSIFIYKYSKWFSASGNNQFRLYHDRFRVYILQKITSKTFSQFNNKLIQICNQSITSNSNEENKLYALEHLSSHLFVKAMLDSDGSKLKQFAYDTTIWELQIKASKGFEWSKKMLGEMMQWASKFDEEEVIECALNKIDLYYQEQNDAPRIVGLVSDGDIEMALQRIEVFGGNDKEGLEGMFILYMLCLMELTLLESKDKHHAKTSIEKILKHLDDKLPKDNSILNWINFFPSYLMFKIIIELKIKSINYNSLFQLFKPSSFNTKDFEWISKEDSYNDLKLDVINEFINNIKNDQLNVEVFNYLLIALVKIKKYDQVFEKIDDFSVNVFYNKDFTLSNVTSQIAENGDADRALSSIIKINDIYIKANTYCNIAKILINLDRIKDSYIIFDKAIALSKEINNEFKRYEVLAKLSTLLFFQNKIKESNQLMNSVIDKEKKENSDILKNILIKNISIEYINQNNLNNSLKFFKQIPKNDAKNQIKLLVNIAKNIAVNNRDFNYLKILQKAINIANKNPYEDTRNGLIELISNTFAEIGCFEKAFSLRKSIKNKNTCFMYQKLKNILFELIKLDKFKDVSNIYLNNLKSSHEITVQNLSLILKSVSIEKANQFKFSESIFLASKIKYESEFYSSTRGLTLMEISLRMCDLETSNDYLEIARSISDRFIKCQTLVKLSDKILKQGKEFESKLILDEALDIAYELNNKSNQVILLTVIAKTLREQGDYEKSYGYIQQAIQYSDKIVNERDKNRKIIPIISELILQGKLFKAIEIAKKTTNKDNEGDKSKVLINLSKDLFRQGKINEAKFYLNEAMSEAKIIKSVFYRDFALSDVCIEYSKQINIEETLEILKYINDEQVKANVIEKINITLINQNKFEFAMQNIISLNLKRLKLKSELIKSICCEFVKLGEYRNSELFSLKIDDFETSQSCWKCIGSIMINSTDYFTALKNISHFKDEEVRINIRKGILTGINLENINREILLDLIKSNKPKTSYIEEVLQHFAILQIFFSNLPQEKLDRYNRTLNLQWAIDIKNQLPN
jgi:tetratricopeptide (TPR) repeat protein